MSNVIYCKLSHNNGQCTVKTSQHGLDMLPFRDTTELRWNDTDLLTAMNRLGEYDWHLVLKDGDDYIFSTSY